MALRRGKRWVQTSAMLYGDNKARSARSIAKSQARQVGKKKDTIIGVGYGGHFRAIQGFKYVGAA